MPDDLGRLVAAIEGEDPSPEFVAQLRADLDTELADEAPDDTVVVDLSPVDDSPTGRQTMERKWLVFGGAAAVVVVLIAVVAGVVLADDNNDDDEVAVGVDGTTVSDDYFEAWNSGDSEAVMALLATDVVIERTLDDMEDSFVPTVEQVSREDWEKTLAWDHAQGSQYTAHECSTSSENGDSTTVVCEFGIRNQLTQAAGSDTVPVVSTMVIVDDEIQQLRLDYGPPDFSLVLTAFGVWMEANHPEVEYFFDGTVEEAAAAGTRLIEYAAEWVQSMEENGCGFADTTCTTEVGISRTFMEALDSWDADTATALLASDAVIVDLAENAEEYVALSAYHEATGWRFHVNECREVNEGPPAIVRCTYTTENDMSRALGVGPFIGSFFQFQIADGEIIDLTHKFDTTAYSPQVWTPFLSWVRSNHPGDVGTMYDLSGSEQLPLTTPESVALWERYTTEFAESLAE
ncbi:MAG: nuclear transport factor 2 family protein [Acidimicrobiales bacterium]